MKDPEQSILGATARAGACAISLLAASLWLGAGQVLAEVPDPCAGADAALAATGAGDRDHDGLSNCRERRVLGTKARDWDTDDDGVSDSDEVGKGTNPTDADSDDDGLDDGSEHDMGTDPTSADSDHDGEVDGEDADPSGELDSKIEGRATAVTCPSGELPGTMSVLGIPIALEGTTEYEHVESCDALAGLVSQNGGVHVDVKVTGDLGAGFHAVEVEAKDLDDDGSPGSADHDDQDDDGGDD